MGKEELLEKIAPCSLMCHTCMAYKKGVICESAENLLKYMDGVKEFYEKHRPEEVENFSKFKDELTKYSQGNCNGCRDKEHCGCSIEGCFIFECTKEHGVDFCGECPEFPCSKTKNLFEEEVYLQWLKGNEQIKDLGIEEFWNKNMTKPHYGAYKK